MMEFTPFFINKHLPTREFLNYLRGLNFKFFVVDDGNGWPLVETTEPEIEKLGNCHLFLSRRDIAEHI
jgi:hypothetical protein